MAMGYGARSVHGAAEAQGVAVGVRARERCWRKRQVIPTRSTNSRNQIEHCVSSSWAKAMAVALASVEAVELVSISPYMGLVWELAYRLLSMMVMATVGPFE